LALGFFKGRLTKLAEKDKRVREEDLKKPLDSQLDSLVWGVIVGALFGGLTSLLLARGVDFLGVFNLITQPLQQASVIYLVAIGIVVGVLAALYSANEASLWIKVPLTRDYAEAREIIEKRQREKV